MKKVIEEKRTSIWIARHLTDRNSDSRKIDLKMINQIKLIVPITVSIMLLGCASPEVVQVKQIGDRNLTCKQIKTAYQDAGEFEEKARKERKITGTNVAAAVLFWPALIGTYRNTDDAIEAARDRQKNLTKIAEEKNCKL